MPVFIVARSQEHLVASCLRKRWSDPPVVSGVRVGGSHFTRKPRLVLTVTLESNQALHSLQALVDSGSERNLVNTGLTTQLGIPLTRLEQAIPARALNNPIFAQISHITKPVTLVTSGNHRESHLLCSPFCRLAPHSRLSLVKTPQSPPGLGGTEGDKLESILPFKLSDLRTCAQAQ